MIIMQPDTSMRPAGTGLPTALVIALQVLAGLGLGIGAAVLGAGIGSRFFAQEGDLVGLTIAGVNGTLALYPLGVAIGLALSGRLLGRGAPFWKPLVGAYVGTLIWLPLLWLGARADARLLWALIGLLGLIGALVAYHWRRR
jgi:hypothetical protein